MGNPINWCHKTERKTSHFYCYCRNFYDVKLEHNKNIYYLHRNKDKHDAVWEETESTKRLISLVIDLMNQPTGCDR